MSASLFHVCASLNAGCHAQRNAPQLPAPGLMSTAHYFPDHPGSTKQFPAGDTVGLLAFAGRTASDPGPWGMGAPGALWQVRPSDPSAGPPTGPPPPFVHPTGQGGGQRPQRPLQALQCDLCLWLAGLLRGLQHAVPELLLAGARRRSPQPPQPPLPPPLRSQLLQPFCSCILLAMCLAAGEHSSWGWGRGQWPSSIPRSARSWRSCCYRLPDVHTVAGASAAAACSAHLRPAPSAGCHTAAFASCYACTMRTAGAASQSTSQHAPRSTPGFRGPSFSPPTTLVPCISLPPPSLPPCPQWYEQEVAPGQEISLEYAFQTLSVLAQGAPREFQVALHLFYNDPEGGWR